MSVIHIDISSGVSMRPTSITLDYSAAEAGSDAFTKAATDEFGRQWIRVDALVSGMFHAERLHASFATPELQAQMVGHVALDRIASAEEIVGSALFLASDASMNLTGELILFDGACRVGVPAGGPGRDVTPGGGRGHVGWHRGASAGRWSAPSTTTGQPTHMPVQPMVLGERLRPFHKNRPCSSNGISNGTSRFSERSVTCS